MTNAEVLCRLYEIAKQSFTLHLPWIDYDLMEELILCALEQGYLIGEIK